MVEVSTLSDELDSFKVKMLPFSFEEGELNEARSQSLKMAKHFPIAQDDCVLLVPSGNGAYAYYLSDQKILVEAFEPFPKLREAAKSYWESTPKTLRWLNSLNDSSRKYDWVMNLGYTFGEEKNIQNSLVNYQALLKPGGKLVLEIIGRDLLEKYFHEKYWVELKKDHFLLNQRKMDYKNGILIENYVFFDLEFVERFSIKKKIFYPIEIEQLLQSLGFTKVQIFGELDLSEYADNADRLLVIAEKRIDTTNSYIKC